MEDSRDVFVTSECTFRGHDYILSLSFDETECMNIEVEDKITAEQWKATFDAQYIEDLTKKTGNFKQFIIFANMLESAISKSSESVSLDLLTYNDLETLRQKKGGLNARSNNAQRPSHLTAKRYLILTYTVEFDRIHYPLPLSYTGKPDPRVLREELRLLKSELKCLKQSRNSPAERTDRLLRNYKKMERDKQQLEEEFSAFRKEVRTSSGSNALKELRTLKVVVKDLEEQLMKEKTKYQRSTNKRSQEYRDLLEEVEELRASERNLRVRVKSLTSELALFKRGRSSTRPGSKDRISDYSRNRSLSSERIPLSRGSSRERRPPFGHRKSQSNDRLYSPSTSRRTNSLDRSQDRSRLSNNSKRSNHRSRTPSPAGHRRFNPTAYVKEKERKLKETELKRNRERRANLSGTPSKSRQDDYCKRNSISSLQRSRENSVKSDGYGSDGSYTARSRSSNHSNSHQPRNVEGSLNLRSGKLKHYNGTPDSKSNKTRARTNHFEHTNGPDNEESDFDRSAEISEIDERLDRLQELMKATMP